MPIDGSLEMFPDCPAAYLRTGMDVQALSLRWGKPVFDKFLMDGVTHPASIIGAYAAELESGARSVESITPRAMALVHIWNRETQAKRDYERQLRKDK